MAGSLEVTDELCWMPAGWVFDAVLERMALVVYPQDPALVAWLLAVWTEANGGYLDLRDLEGETWKRLCHAADRAYGHLTQEEEQAGGGPEGAEGLRTQFQQRRTMLHTARKTQVGQPSRRATRPELAKRFCRNFLCVDDVRRVEPFVEA